MRYHSVQIGLTAIALMGAAGLVLAMLYFSKAEQKQQASAMESSGSALGIQAGSIMDAQRGQALAALRECAAPGPAEAASDDGGSGWDMAAACQASIGATARRNGMAEAAFFAPDGRMICQSEAPGYEGTDFFGEIKAAQAFAKGSEAVFCAKAGGRLFEYFGKALPGTPAGAPQGYLYLVREVGDSLIAQCSAMMGSGKAGLAMSEREVDEARQAAGDAAFCSRQLSNQYGNPVAYIYFQDGKTKAGVLKGAMPALYTIVAIMLLTIAAIMLYVRIVIMKPLAETERIVGNGAFEELHKISSGRTEFGALGKAISAMLKQKRETQDLCKSLKQSSADLEEQRNTLERQKKDIESQIVNLEVLNQQVMEHDKETDRKNLRLALKNKELEEQCGQNKNLRSLLEETEYRLRHAEKSLQKTNEALDTNQNYAARLRNVLQTNMTPTKHIFNDFFILSRPKEKIGGDFWFAKKIENWVIAGVGDCNMQGISGAMISAIDLFLLEEIISRAKISELSPDTVLNSLNDKIQSTIGENIAADIERDGLHLSIFMYNTKTLKGLFAASKRTMVITRQGEVSEYFGDNLSIGKIHDGKKFNLIPIQLMTDDTIYMFTDGCTEVVGGPYCKSLLTANFKKEIAKKQIYPIQEQKNQFTKFFGDWIGDLEQTDDITMLAYRI